MSSQNQIRIDNIIYSKLEHLKGGKSFSTYISTIKKEYKITEEALKKITEEAFVENWAFPSL